MKHVVTSLVFGDVYNEIAKISFRTMADYAKKIGADFVPITRRIFRDEIYVHWEKLQCASLLDRYDRVIYFDSDIIVAADTPSLFEYVPYAYFGGFNEAAIAERQSYLLTEAAAHGLGPKLLDGKQYLNLGVQVFDRNHRNVFQMPAEWRGDPMPEQTYLNIKLLNQWVPICFLPRAFNCFAASKPEDYLSSYVLHYAGWCEPSRITIVDRMKEDIQCWVAQGRAPQHWITA